MTFDQNLLTAVRNLEVACHNSNDVNELDFAQTKVGEILRVIQAHLAKSQATQKKLDGMDAQIKSTFKDLDTSGNGRLDFDEFLMLLRRGDDGFDAEQALALFNSADKDLCGDLCFDEFVDFLFDNEDATKLVAQEPSNCNEEEAKAAVLQRCVRVRQMAVKAVQDDGRTWAELSWQERLQEVRQAEEESDDEMEFPPFIPAERQISEEEPTPTPTPVSAEAKRPTSTGFSANGPFAAGMIDGGVMSKRKEGRRGTRPSIKMVTGGSRTKIGDMNQSELVDYSFTSEDIEFGEGHANAEEDLWAFKERLRVAGSPLEVMDIKKYVAKGTAGWIFIAERKDSGEKVAVKLIRMTQIRTGLREWYSSKLLRSSGVENLVLTREEAFVLPKAGAPDVVADQLKNAGPVPYYVCLIQDFMPGGTLENLSEKGAMDCATMLKGLEDVARTLAAMHDSAHVSHRDVKPENVLVTMEGSTLVNAKLCDLGQIELSDCGKGRADDVRRFGIMVYAMATGEMWTKHRLLRQDNNDLVERLSAAMASQPAGPMRSLPEFLREMLIDLPPMSRVAARMAELRAELQSGS